jgi:hypothetical protein
VVVVKLKPGDLVRLHPHFETSVSLTKLPGILSDENPVVAQIPPLTVALVIAREEQTMPGQDSELLVLVNGHYGWQSVRIFRGVE